MLVVFTDYYFRAAKYVSNGSGTSTITPTPQSSADGTNDVITTQGILENITNPDLSVDIPRGLTSDYYLFINFFHQEASDGGDPELWAPDNATIQADTQFCQIAQYATEADAVANTNQLSLTDVGLSFQFIGETYTRYRIQTETLNEGTGLIAGTPYRVFVKREVESNVVVTTSSGH